METNFGASVPYTVAVEEDLGPLLLCLFAVILRRAYQAIEVEEHTLLIFALALMRYLAISLTALAI
jgi:hypothetical protein